MNVEANKISSTLKSISRHCTLHSSGVFSTGLRGTPLSLAQLLELLHTVLTVLMFDTSHTEKDCTCDLPDTFCALLIR